MTRDTRQTPGQLWAGRAGAVLLIIVLALLGRQAALRSIDFPVYHRAAQQILAGNFELYPVEAYGGQPGPSQGFRYAPAIAFLFVPLGWLPLEASAFVFYVLKLATLWWMGSVVMRRAAVPAWGQRLFVLAFVIAGGYLVEELRFGNAHLFVVALMLLAFDRAESGQVVLPAVSLAIAVATKLTPLALLAYFALRRRVAVCLATLACLVLLVVLPSAVMGHAGNVRQLRAFTTYALEKVDEADNYSLRGALIRYLAPGQPDISHVAANVATLSMPTINVLWLVGLLALGLAALAALWPSSTDPVVTLLEFSIVLTGIVLASPHTQRRYFVALWVPVVLLLALLRRTSNSVDRRAVLAGLLATALPATLLPLVFGGRRLALLYEAASPYFFGALILFAVLVVLTRREKSRLPPAAAQR